MTEDLSEEAAAPSGWTVRADTADGGRVTVVSRVAAVILGLFGAGFVWVGVLAVFTGLNPSGGDPGYVVTEFGQGVRSVFVTGGFVVAVLAAVEVVAAVAVWMGRAWGRILGVLYAAVFGVGSLLVLLTSVDRGPSATGVALVAGWFAAYAFVAVALIARWRRQ